MVRSSNVYNPWHVHPILITIGEDVGKTQVDLRALYLISEAIMAIYPANTRRSLNTGVMLGMSRRGWASIRPALGERLVFAG